MDDPKEIGRTRPLSPGQPTTPTQPATRAGQLNHTPPQAISPHTSAYPGDLKLRRAASYRLPPLASGRRDPWGYDDELTAGYEAAASHLLCHGLLPAPNLAALRVMWRCGGRQRRDAEIIADSWGLVA